jgi:hypothetical protein
MCIIKKERCVYKKTPNEQWERKERSHPSDANEEERKKYKEKTS